MKFFNYKRHKFSTIFKNISFKRSVFGFYFKYFQSKLRNLIKMNGYTNLKNLNFFKLFKHIDTRRFNFSKLYRHINFRRFNFSKLYKLIDFKVYKYIKISVPISILLLIFIYFSLPMFHKFDKLNIENLICKDLNVTCSVEGKIKYNPKKDWVEIYPRVLRNPEVFFRIGRLYGDKPVKTTKINYKHRFYDFTSNRINLILK